MEIVNQIVGFIQGHSAVMAGALVAVLDLVFALNKSWQSNGILHSVYVFCKNLMGKQA